MLNNRTRSDDRGMTTKNVIHLCLNYAKKQSMIIENNEKKKLHCVLWPFPNDDIYLALEMPKETSNLLERLSIYIDILCLLLLWLRVAHI